VATILDIPNTVWRDQLLPASFGYQEFFCEVNSREGGQRAVTHEFPKKDLPYTEPMGRRAMEFSVRGYCIAYPFNSGQTLWQRDYRVPRNALVQVLDAGDPAVLQLPTQAPMWVVCTRYRMTEEERFGGYCVFDMSFVEYGKTENPAPNVTGQLLASVGVLKGRVQAIVNSAPKVTSLQPSAFTQPLAPRRIPQASPPRLPPPPINGIS
jgi:prophage DNA circulation protein